MPVIAEKEQLNKSMAELRKQLNFLDNTKWMFENNEQLPSDNFSPNQL